MTKIVYNSCYGGFGLSREAVERYAEIKGIKLYPEADGKYSALGIVTYWTVPRRERVRILEGAAWQTATQEERIASNKAWESLTISDGDIARDDPVLVQVVEELGEKANGHCASLAIEDVPKGTRYRIDEYDGNERVMTCTDYDWSIAS